MPIGYPAGMRKLILSFVATLPLCLSLTACDPGDGGTDSDTSSSGEGTEGSTASEGSGEGGDGSGEGSGSAGEGSGTAGEGSGSAGEGDGTAGEGDGTAGEGDGTAGEGDGGGDPQMLCEGSGGTWDETSCGDYTCGEPPACEAIIPGCDCGKGANFVEGFGCKEDPACGSGETDGGDAAALCENTGGIWDENSCGHYKCGNVPDCDAIIPGCNCGTGASFKEGTGCADDPTCG